MSHATDVTFKKAQRVRYEPREKQQNLPMESEPPESGQGAKRRSEPLTARTDLESYEGEGKGIPQPSSHLPTKNPEYPLQ